MPCRAVRRYPAIVSCGGILGIGMGELINKHDGWFAVKCRVEIEFL